jgi:hypothetical protein
MRPKRTTPRMRVPVACSRCGKVSLRPPSELPKSLGGQTYCSKQCRYTPPQPVLSDDGLTARIPLRNHAGDLVGYAIVDAVDAEWAGQWCWSLDSKGYAIRAIGPRDNQHKIRLHRELLGLVHGDGIEGDHINRNRLDDRRSNLRSIPKAGNRQNVSARGGSSPFRGVSWNKRLRKWTAHVRVNGKRINLGCFIDEAAAAEAARLARLRLLPYSVDEVDLVEGNTTRTVKRSVYRRDCQVVGQQMDLFGEGNSQ